MPLRLWTLIAGWLRALAGRRAAPPPEEATGVSPWLALRTAPASDEDDLTTQGAAWLEALPEHAQPRRLAQRHPRVVNRLAQVWADPLAAADGLDGLLIDGRGDRGGFSPAIRAELKRLQYLQRKLAEAPLGTAGRTGLQPLESAAPAPAPRTATHSSDA